MITQPPQQRRGRASVLVLGVALVGVVALATSRAARYALFSGFGAWNAASQHSYQEAMCVRCLARCSNSSERERMGPPGSAEATTEGCARHCTSACVDLTEEETIERFKAEYPSAFVPSPPPPPIVGATYRCLCLAGITAETTADAVNKCVTACIDPSPGSEQQPILPPDYPTYNDVADLPKGYTNPAWKATRANGWNWDPRTACHSKCSRHASPHRCPTPDSMCGWGISVCGERHCGLHECTCACEAANPDPEYDTCDKIKEDAKRNKLALAHGLGLFSGVAEDGGVGGAMQQQQMQQQQMQHQMHGHQIVEGSMHGHIGAGGATQQQQGLGR